MAEKEDKEFNIEISQFDGLSPAYFANSWSYIGNKNQANSQVDTDTSDPNILTQGGGTTPLTAGTQAGSMSTLVSSILRTTTSSNVGWAVGGAKLYKLSSSAVIATGGYPMTIDKGGVTGEDATDLIFYKSNLYIFYNHSGSLGDIAKLTIATDTLDPDWGSTTPSGAGSLISAPHYSILGGDDKMAFTNGNYVGTFDGTTLNTINLDFFTDSQAVTITYNANRYVVGVNRPNITGSNFNQSAIYNWDGVSPSWDGDPIEVNGRIGALYTKNGTTYVWWQDGVGTGTCNFGYINGTILSTIKRYDGSLPNQAQVGEYFGFIMWLSGAKLMMWGSGDIDLSVKMFHYLTAQYATTGAIGTPFGELLISSTASTNYSLNKESGYSVLSNWFTPAFSLESYNGKAIIDKITIITDTIGTGGVCVPTLYWDNSLSNYKTLNSVVSGQTRHLVLTTGVPVRNFKLGLDFSTGSATNPVKIRNIFISGKIITQF